jgi:hypothetical protein
LEYLLIMIRCSLVVMGHKSASNNFGVMPFFNVDYFCQNWLLIVVAYNFAACCVLVSFEKFGLTYSPLYTKFKYIFKTWGHDTYFLHQNWKSLFNTHKPLWTLTISGWFLFYYWHDWALTIIDSVTALVLILTFWDFQKSCVFYKLSTRFLASLFKE